MRDIPLKDGQCKTIQIGTLAFIHLIDVPLDSSLPLETLIEYDLLIDGATAGIALWAQHLLYGVARCPHFVLRARIDQLLHDSCHKCCASTGCWHRNTPPRTARHC